MDFESTPQLFQSNGDWDRRKLAPPALLLIAIVFWFHGLGASVVMVLLVATLWLPLKQGKDQQILPISGAWLAGIYSWMITEAAVITPIAIGLLTFIVVEMYLQSE